MQDQINTYRTDLMKLAHEGIKEATKQGADDAKIVIGTQWSNRLVVETGELSLASSLETRQVGVQVIKDQKKGSAAINTISQEALTKAISEALDLARFSVRDPFLVLPDKVEAPRAKDLPFFYEDKLANFSTESMQEIMLNTLEIFKRDSRIALERYELTLDVSWNGLVNSRGVVQDIKQSLMSWNFAGMSREGDQVSGMDYDSYFSFTGEKILEKSKSDAELFVKKLIQNLNPKRCPSYKGIVVLSPRAVMDVILHFVLYHAGGRQVMDGKSRWTQVGNQVLSPLVTMIDDPHSSFFSHAATFDGDGLPTRKQPIIENGVLKTILHDCYSAKKCSTQSTAMSGGPFGLRIKSGSESLSSLLANHGQVLLVDRYSGNTDPVDGSFSGVAKSSRLYQNGVDRGPVIETMISGNFFDIAHSILALSSETEVVWGQMESPYFLVDGVSVTGAGD
jgi:PmbA protein